MVGSCQSNSINVLNILNILVPGQHFNIRYGIKRNVETLNTKIANFLMNFDARQVLVHGFDLITSDSKSFLSLQRGLTAALITCRDQNTADCWDIVCSYIR